MAGNLRGRRLVLAGGVLALGAAAAARLWPRRPAPLPAAAGLTAGERALYARPARSDGPRRVYHLGHSLVGRDMPAMLAQLAGPGHRYGLQLGWGTSIAQHLSGDIAGFAAENATPAFHPLADALADPGYDAVVFTEMVTLEDAIRHHDSAGAVARLVAAVRAGNPGAALYLYETWHRLDQGDWLARIGADWDRLWEPHLLAPAVRAAGGPVHVVPAGRVLARLVATIEAAPGGIGGMTRREDLFARTAGGGQDMIHLGDLGAYAVALVHYAVLYRRAPLGLPHALLRADGSPATAPAPALAAHMQRVVWEVVAADPLTGVA